MSDGLRGEANEYWKSPDTNMEDGRLKRRKEATDAAHLLGAQKIEFWGLTDYPMTITDEHIERIAHEIRSFQPDIILTHANYDHFNPDHNAVHLAVRKATAVASGAGFLDEHPVASRQTPIFGFEPQMTEASQFNPVIYNDVTNAFQEKLRAMRMFITQPGMYGTYVRKAEMRGDGAKLRGGRSDCQFAETFEVYQPIAAIGDLIW